MKNFKLLLLSGATILFTACNSDNVNEPTLPPLSDNEGKSYEVSLSLGGEFVEVSESPMSRADEIPAPKNYYGINVYCMKTDGTESSFSKYAYGVFDNTSDMKITLLEGYKYRFECTTVKEVNNWYQYIHNYNNSSNTAYILQPFGTYAAEYDLFYNSRYSNGYRYTSLNTFTTSASTNLTSIKYGSSDTGFYQYNGNYYFYHNGSRFHEYPALDRFYGELEDYIPTANGVATIHLKRTAFGLNLVINGVPDGSLSWSNSDLNYLTSEYSSTETIEIPNIYTFNEVYKCWQNQDTYTKDFTLNFVWTRANGYQQKFSKTFTAKRNVNTTLTVNLEGGANNVTFGLQEDDTEMGSENENVDYNGGALTDTDVDPVE